MVTSDILQNADLNHMLMKYKIRCGTLYKFKLNLSLYGSLIYLLAGGI